MKTFCRTFTTIAAMLLFFYQSNAQNTNYGVNALASNTTGTENSAFGYESLFFNTTGPNNTATGFRSLYSNIGGALNTANGHQALFYNTSGTGNSAMGAEALTHNTTGYYNTAGGLSALFNNTTGIYNTAVGTAAMQNNTTGSQNTAIGEQALISNITGKSNTAIGYYADVNKGNLSNSTAVGHRALTTANNQVRLGNSFITSIGGYAGWTQISDARVKKNIRSNVPGLAFINKLKPVTYNYDLDAADKIIQPVIKTKDGQTLQPGQDDITARKAKEQIIYTGFIAQDVEKAARELNYDFSGVDVAKNDKDLYGLRYAEFVVPLVKAAQELSTKNDALQKQIDELRTMIMQGNKNSSGLSNNKAEGMNAHAGSLEQNIPNPFSQSTSIHYSLAQNFASAQIIITDNTGKTIKQINVAPTQKGTLNIEAGTFSAGTYTYSLIANGRLIDTKKMIVIK